MPSRGRARIPGATRHPARVVRAWCRANLRRTDYAYAPACAVILLQLLPYHDVAVDREDAFQLSRWRGESANSPRVDWETTLASRRACLSAARGFGGVRILRPVVFWVPAL